MKKSSFWWAAFMWFILTASYLYSAPAEPIQLEFGVREMNASSNIIHFSHNDDFGEDLIFLAYTGGNETYSVPDENGKYFDIKFVRKTQEKIDRMVNSTGYDGYFIGDEVDDAYGRMFKITGVVRGNVCYYRSEEIVFERLPYRTVWDYDKEKGTVTVERYPSYWRHILLYGGLISLLGSIVLAMIKGENSE